MTVRGAGGHSGAPAKGVNAIAVMARVMDTIGRYQQELTARRPAEYVEIFPDAPCDVLNFGTIHGGIALNMITEECKLRVSYRTLPDADPLDVLREIERRLARSTVTTMRAANIARKSRPHFMNIVPPLNSPRGTALEARCSRSPEQRPRAARSTPPTAHGSPRSGITSLICGPGDLEQAHQPNEHVRRDAFERGPAMIAKVIERLCCAA